MIFFILKIGSWIGPRIKGFRLGPKVAWWGPQGPDEAGLGVLKKRLVNRVGGGLGSIIKKPAPNPARCHSYSSLSRYKIKSSIVFPLTNKS